jgi:hypothetical protein
VVSEEDVRKNFFFEKKKQKTFTCRVPRKGDELSVT